MKRGLLTFFATLIALITVLAPFTVAILTWVLTTEPGLQFAWNRAQGVLPPGLTIEAVQGRLADSLTVKGLHYETEGLRLHLDQGLFKWRPRDITQGALTIEQLALEGVTYTQLAATPKPEPEPKEPFKLPDAISLPIDVHIEQAKVTGFVFQSSPQAKPLVIDRASLAAAYVDQTGTIRELVIQGPQIDLNVHAQITTRDAYPLAGTLSWRLMPPDIAPVEGHTELAGSLKALEIKQQLGEPYKVTAHAIVHEPFDALRLDMVVEVDQMDLTKIRADLPPISRLSTHIEAHGVLDDLAIQVQAEGDAPEIGGLQARLTGTVGKQQVRLSQLSLKAQHAPTSLEARGHVALGAQPEMDLTADWQAIYWPLTGEPMVTSPKGHVGVTGTLQDLTAQLTLALGEQGHLEGHARREHERLDAALSWRNLSWPMQDGKPLAGSIPLSDEPLRNGSPRQEGSPSPSMTQVESPEGSLTVKGRVEDYTLALNAKLGVPDRAKGEVKLAGNGSLERLRFDKIDITALEGQLKGQATMAWKPTLDVKADLKGTGINPGVLAKDWPGSLDTVLKVSAAKTKDGVLTARVTDLQVAGRLRDQPVALNTRGAYGPEGARLEVMELTSGPTHLTAEGLIGMQRLDLRWRAASENLNTLLPKAQGQFESQGHIEGPLPLPRVVATLSGAGLAYGDFKAARLALDANIDLIADRHSHLTLELSSGQAGGVEIKRVALKGQGTRRDHKLTLSAVTSVGEAELGLTGVLAGLVEHEPLAWAFRLQRIRLQYVKLPAWILAEPVQGTLSQDLMELTRTCLTSEGARLCLEGRRTPQGLRAKFGLKALEFKYFAPLLPPELALDGQIASSQGEITREATGALTAQVSLNTSAGKLVLAQSETGPVTVLEFRPSELSLVRDEGLKAQAQFNLQREGFITLNATVPPQGEGPLTERPLDGRIMIKVSDIGFVADLVPDMTALSGRIEGQLNLSGTLAKPEAGGKLVLADGSLQLEKPGITATGVRVELEGLGARGLGMYAAAQSPGGGSLTLKGTADLTQGAAQAEFAITGDQFRVFNTKDARVYVSPDLRITAREDLIRVTGAVRVPKARITPQRIAKSGAVRVSEDQVIITDGKQQDEAEARPEPERKIEAEVRLILGKEVSFEGFGLTGDIGGSLLITERPGEITTATGELNVVDGKYSAYGQDLEIEEGRLLFAGPVSEPALNVRAVRRPNEDVLVGVRVQGPLRKPDFEIFSEPPMSQQTQLSYLLLGRAPEEGASQAEDSQLNQAALALGLKGGDFLADKLGNKLGIDEAGIQTKPGQSSEEAAFVIGEYLSPKLYVSYGIGLFKPVSTVSLEYTLSSKWKFVTESSTIGTGGDFTYTIER